MKVGITGGIGSGKSVLSRIMSAKGCVVFNSDKEAKKLVETDAKIKKQIVQILGAEAYLNNSYNRSFVADKVFGNQELRESLNQIIHPEVRHIYDKLVAQTAGPVFNEAAILFETGAYHSFDKIILVISPSELRLKRIMSRDKCSEVKALSRIDAQWPDEKKIPLADYVLVNDEVQSLLEQVDGMERDLSISHFR
jgi:dephospho-CoA kinase